MCALALPVISSGAAQLLFACDLCTLGYEVEKSLFDRAIEARNY